MSDFKTLPKLVTVAVTLALAGTATAGKHHEQQNHDRGNHHKLQLQDSDIKYTKKAESMLKKT
ncbi:Fibronectin type III-like domain [Vibrio sp. B1FLJ16]|uniref:hypothetical protein n=1 Tax=Vibrio sp. B1FLJ16 TaxID=2751178 RepID=UPI001AF7495A|nr:hypothetical protein [Vibrio sp. B1FLJ16]CAD7822156.1 Fibronectin type III-like domain [Vibrio sp. B1FLJ16]CAE6948235.1 Fibronectin type III-like domain [Vibrio sp. B1FLJ16]